MSELTTAWLLPVLAILVGSTMGYVARRNHFCTLNALERYWFAADGNGLRSWVLAAATALFMTSWLQLTGFVDLSTSFYLTEPVPIAGAIIGGIMFGIGMALVGTCGFGAIIQFGGGNMRAVVVLTGIALAAIAAQRGITAHLRRILIDPLSLDLTLLGGDMPGALFLHRSGISIAFIAGLILACLAFYWVFRSRSFRAAHGKMLAGITIGIAIAMGWLITYQFSLMSFDPVQLEAGSFVAPLGDTILQIITVTGAKPDYGVGLAVGVFIGAAFAAWRADNVRWEACDDARELGRHLAGAFLMGTGGVFALGCTIGQGVSAVSTLSATAPIAILSIAFGARLGLGWLIEGSAFGFLRRHRTLPAE